MDISDYLSANAQGLALNPLSGLTPDEENALRARIGMSIGQPAEIQVPALTPADRMRQGMPGLPTQEELNPTPIQQASIPSPPPAGMSHTNGMEDPGAHAPLEPGNIDLNHRPVVRNPDGTVSTVRSIGFNDSGKEVVVPTVSPDGKILSDDEAIALYRKSGQHLGKFRTVDEANTFAQTLHEDQDKLYGDQPGGPRPADAPPSGMAPRAPGGVSSGGLGAVENAQQNAVNQQIEAQRSAERAATEAAAKRQAELQAFQVRTQEAQQREQSAIDERIKAVDEATRKASEPEAKIDRDRWWHGRSTGQKVQSYVAMALSAIGQGLQGFGGVQAPNAALERINHIVGQDIEAQVHDQANSREAKRNALTGSMTALGIAQSTMHDARAQRLFAHSLGLEAVANQAQVDASSSRQEQIKANGATLTAGLKEKAYELRQQAMAREHTAWTEDQHVILQAKTLGAQMADRAAEREKDLQIAGMKGGGKSGDPVDNRMMLDVEGRARTIKDRLQDIRGLIKGGGTWEATGAHNDKLASALEDVAVDYAKLMDPGNAAKETEVESARKRLGSPGFWSRNSTALENIDSFEKSLEQRRLEAYRVRGLQAPASTSKNDIIQRLGARPY